MNRREAVLAAGGLVCTGLLLPRGSIAKSGVKVEPDIAYVAGSSDDDQKLDIYHPEGTGGDGRPRPVLVYVHGGGWGRGDKRLGRSLAPLFVDNGAVFVSLNYRLAPKFRYPIFMRDLAAAMRWLKDNLGRYGGDPEHIVLAGHSAGAHLVALLATDPQFLQQEGLPMNMFRSVVPVDTASFNFLVDPYGWFVGRQKKIREDAFGTDRNTLAAASPTLVVARARPGSVSPIDIFVSGKRPDAVEQSEAFAQAVRTSGNQATVTVVPGVSHAMMNQGIGDRESPIGKGLLASLANR